MSLRHLEHDGNENFLKHEKKKFPNREEDDTARMVKECQDILEDEQNKIKQQEEWMSLSNPALWDGEI